MNGRTASLLIAAMTVWFAIAVAIGATLAGQAGPNFVAISIATPVMVWLAAYGFIPAVRSAIDDLSTRMLVFIHSGRVFGALFLVYSGAGLHPDWAGPAAWADIAVAVTAPAIALYAVPFDTPAKWRWAFAWNVFAVLDIVLAPGSGLVFARLYPQSMAAMTALPLYIIPAFFVPTMILTNILISIRPWRDRPGRTIGHTAMVSK